MANNKRDAAVDMAVKMLTVEIPVEEIAQMSGLPLEQVVELAKSTPIREREDLTEDEYIQNIVKKFNQSQK